MCFSGFLHSGEILIPSDASYNPAAHLSYGDLRVDSTSSPSFIELHIKSSRTDVFRKGILIYFGITGMDLFPVAAILGCMVCHNKSPGPVLVFSDRWDLAHLQSPGERTTQCPGPVSGGCQPLFWPEFCTGVATSAAACGIPNSLINTLGRWESSVYMLCIQTPCSTLSAVSKTLAKAALSKSGFNKN